MSDEPRGYRVHTNTWTQEQEELPPEKVLEWLEDVDEHFDAAVQSLKPTED